MIFEWWEIVLALGATVRGTRLVNWDVIAAPLRTLLISRDGRVTRHLGVLVTCAWCTSPYVAGLAFTTAYFWGHTAAWQITTFALTVSYLYAAVVEPIVDPRDE